MAIMQWNKTFETNIKKIDEQHQGLVNILNSLHDSMLKGDSNSEMGKLLEKLVNYTVIHFKTEEELFDKHGFPETTKHKAEHNDLTGKASKLLKDHKAGATVVSADLMYFLKDWLKNHILGSDKKYGPFLNAKGVY
ncbi:MAG: hemerythrin family protein [Ignavibacteriae bacterium]|nr:hemerythrin family protein [Ignavibacteriota bacterium]